MPSYLVTGTTKNIGLAFVQQLVKDPDNVVIALNRRAMPTKVEGVHEVRGDLGDLQSLQIAAKEIERITNGKLDVMILNAGGLALFKPEQLGVGKEAEIGNVMCEEVATGCTGHLQLVSLLLACMKQGNLKKIVAIGTPHSWLNVIRGFNYQSSFAYAGAKAMLDVIIARLGNELEPEGFTVFTLCASFVFLDEYIIEVFGSQDNADAFFKSKYPEFTGITSGPEGARIMLDVITKMQPKDSGRRVGMWGTEGRYVLDESYFAPHAENAYIVSSNNLTVT